MSNDPPQRERSPTRHLALREPSPWVLRFAERVPAAGRVLDLACGGGRHTRLFLDLGHPVLALDRDISWIADLAGRPGLETLEVDLEDGRPFPLVGQRFAGVVVANYLYRPHLPALIETVAPGGALIYETFARGNERFGRPSNPAHLLEAGELLDAVRGILRVLAYEDLDVERPKPAAVQRICAVREE
jgi:SAM-dependent methyltransferase